MFLFILIVQHVASGFTSCTLFKSCFVVRKPISSCFVVFFSYRALHYTAKIPDKHELMYFTHMRYEVL